MVSKDKIKEVNAQIVNTVANNVKKGEFVEDAPLYKWAIRSMLGIDVMDEIPHTTNYLRSILTRAFKKEGLYASFRVREGIAEDGEAFLITIKPSDTVYGSRQRAQAPVPLTEAAIESFEPGCAALLEAGLGHLPLKDIDALVGVFKAHLRGFVKYKRMGGKEVQG